MLTINKIFPQEKIPEKTESFLCFDIETTGFSRDNTILYLIGCGYFAEEGFQFIQWFNDDGTSEEEILLAFQNILSKKDWQLVTFNGNSFDIPYLKRHYDLNELTCDIEKYPSLDFYQFLKPFQNLFQMTHGKQKDWEQFLGLNREDKYDGGQLIAVYKDYLMSKDEDLLHNLLLHNEDDLLGMKYLLPLFSYRQIFLEDITLQRIAPANKVFERGNGSIAISCRLPLPLPQPLEVSTPIGELFSDKKDLSILTITLPFVEDVLKHFYKDYHNYYYLPKEEGCPKVVVTDLARDDMAEAVEDAFRYGKLILATTTYNGDIFPFMKEFINHLTERSYQNRTIGFVENGSWTPMAAKIMKAAFEKSKNITFADTTVTIRSAVDETSEAQIVALAKEMK